MTNNLPEKARLLELLRAGKFQVPDFIYVSAREFENKDFAALEEFLKTHRQSYKVIARSAHPLEHLFKGGTLDSLETYADVEGILYARNRIIKMARQAKRLSVLRQQIFNNAPQIKLDDMGIVVMPFVNGQSIMAKLVSEQWEFGYCSESSQKIQSEPFITNTPHDRRLLQLSKDIQQHLGFKCEIEYIVSDEGEIWVVQAKDISAVDTREIKEIQHSIKLDGIRRIRVRKSYRERPIFVMNNKEFYIRVISACEDLLLGTGEKPVTLDDIISIINAYEKEMEEFAVTQERFGVIGLSIRDPKELYQVANHYLDEKPELQEKLSAALRQNLYRIDYFLAEADTLLAKDRFRINLCSHDAYGVDTLRNPLWNIYWYMERHEQVVAEFLHRGFRTGDTVGIDVGQDLKPTVYRM
jgi:hypothetical protein